MSVANEPFPWDFHSATLGHHYSWEVCLAAALDRIGGRSLENHRFGHNFGLSRRSNRVWPDLSKVCSKPWGRIWTRSASFRPFQDLLAHHDVKEARKTELLSGCLTEIDQKVVCRTGWRRGAAPIGRRGFRGPAGHLGPRGPQSWP